MFDFAQLYIGSISPLRHNSICRSDQWERVQPCTAEGATPVTAQAHEPLDQANLESAKIVELAWRVFALLARCRGEGWGEGILATEGAHNASCNLSGIKDRWGAARIRAAPFYFSESLYDVKANSFKCSTSCHGRENG